MYESAINDKRLQLLSENKFCYEGIIKLFNLNSNYDFNNFLIKYQDGFDEKILKNISFFPAKPNDCMFHSIDLVMKKDAIVDGQSDTIKAGAVAMA